MGKYKAKGGAMGGFTIGFIILLIAGGLIALTVWLIIKNEAPATCDVSVSKVTVAATPPSGSTTYPVTIDYSGNGSNACNPNAKVSIAAVLTDSNKNKTNIPPPTTLPGLSEGTYTVQATDPKTTVSLTYFLVNPDGSEGPTHSYP